MNNLARILFVLLLVCFCILLTIDINNRPTTKEVKTMIDSDTTSIFHINNAGRLESCLYTLIEIETLEIAATIRKTFEMVSGQRGTKAGRSPTRQGGLNEKRNLR